MKTAYRLLPTAFLPSTRCPRPRQYGQRAADRSGGLIDEGDEHEEKPE